MSCVLLTADGYVCHIITYVMRPIVRVRLLGNIHLGEGENRLGLRSLLSKYINDSGFDL